MLLYLFFKALFTARLKLILYILQTFNSQTVGVVLEEDNGEGGSITVIVDGMHFRNAWR